MSLTVYGVECDERGAQLVKKVVLLSTWGVILLTFLFVYNNSVGHTVADGETSFGLGTTGFVLGLTIPACGYFGAKNKSKDLLRWYERGLSKAKGALSEAKGAQS